MKAPNIAAQEKAMSKPEALTIPLMNLDNQFEHLKKLADKRMQLAVCNMYKIKHVVNFDLDLKNGGASKKSKQDTEESSTGKKSNKFKIQLRSRENDEEEGAGFRLGQHF